MNSQNVCNKNLELTIAQKRATTMNDDSDGEDDKNDGCGVVGTGGATMVTTTMVTTNNNICTPYYSRLRQINMLAQWCQRAICHARPCGKT